LRTKLKVLDLFSGIGGFSLGLHSTGIFDTTKFVEFDSFCQKVLNKNFPNIPIEGDIRNVKGQEFEADVITGGFPCQPFSVAGKQKGTNDNRYLWPEMFRLIKEIKPEFVIGENVQGLINLQNGMVLRQVQDQLEGEGFEVQCFLIPASGIGAWHQRNRVWIVGHSKHNGLLAAEKRCRDQEINGRSQEGQNQTIELERTSGSRDNENVSNTQSIGTGECRDTNQKEGREGCSSTQSNGQRSNVSNTIGKLRDGCSSTTRDSGEEFIGLECSEGWHWNEVRGQTERCSEQGQSTHRTWWQIESDLCGIPHGISRVVDKNRSNRIKSLGNAIVPQIARIFGLAIKKVLHETTL
jgi:DNA-cytosine methyltransferase